MRHVYVNRFTYLLGLVLVLAVLLFAWLRSRSVSITVLDAEPGPVGQWDWQLHGQTVYDAECNACHAQLTHIPELFSTGRGRAYLIDFMLFGFDGEATIAGRSRQLRHLPFDHLGNEELAAVLNHTLVSWGNRESLPQEAQYYEPREIELARTRDLSRQEVARSRPPP